MKTEDEIKNQVVHLTEALFNREPILDKDIIELVKEVRILKIILDKKIKVIIE